MLKIDLQSEKRQLIMKKFLLLFILMILFSCNTFHKQYRELNANAPKSKSYLEQLKLIKPIISKEKKPFILIILWKKSILTLNEPLHYTALLYDPLTKEKKICKTTKDNPKETLIIKDFSEKDFREFSFILENYLEGNENYLLSLEDSFTGATEPFYIYDFIKHTKLKINRIGFTREGRLIQ